MKNFKLIQVVPEVKICDFKQLFLTDSVLSYSLIDAVALMLWSSMFAIKQSKNRKILNKKILVACFVAVHQDVWFFVKRKYYGW